MKRSNKLWHRLRGAVDGYAIGIVRLVGFQARDVVTGQECEVSEDLASTSLCDGEIMFAHLVPIDGTTLLDAISPLSFPPGLKRRLLQLTRTTSLREVYFVLARPELPKRIN